MIDLLQILHDDLVHAVTRNLRFLMQIKHIVYERRKDIFINQSLRRRKMIKVEMARKVRVQKDDFILLIRLIYWMLPDYTGLMDVFFPFKNTWTYFLVFHHDGPFDACRPHRNKQPHKAPVAAFPANSITNTLAGGLGEVPGLDRDQYFGLPQNEAFQDYGVVSAKSRSRRGSDPQDRPSVRVISDGDERLKIRPTVGYRSTSFDPRLKTEPVHGEESAGLGTSTFLEGAPAPKSAIEKAEKEDESEMNGLTRKKSLVQKIKGRRATGVGDRSPPPLASPLIVSANGSSAALVDTPYNPFTKEGQFIERVESIDSTKASRERADSGGSDKGNPGGGLLGRVKSLKISGGRKQS